MRLPPVPGRLNAEIYVEQCVGVYTNVQTTTCWHGDCLYAKSRLPDLVAQNYSSFLQTTTFESSGSASTDQDCACSSLAP